MANECFKDALENLRYMDKSDIEEYVRDLFNQARKIDKNMGATAIDQATKEVNAATAKELFNLAKQKERNIAIFKGKEQKIRDKKADVRGLLYGRNTRESFLRRKEGESVESKENLSAAKDAEREKIWGFVLGDLTKDEVARFTDGKDNESIMDAFDGKKVDDPFAKKIAETIEKYFAYSKEKLIQSGAMQEKDFNKGRYFTQVHNESKIIRMGKEAWKALISKHINWEGTFEKSDASVLNGGINSAKADKILDKSYNNITTGKSEIHTQSLVVNDREAVARKKRIFYEFNSLRDQMEYNKLAGEGDLFYVLMRDIHSTASKVAIAENWGDNPLAMYADLRHVHDEVNTKTPKWWKGTDLLYNSVMGLDRGSVSPTASVIWSNLRAITSMARLPLVMVRSFSDLAFIADWNQKFGTGFFDSWGELIKHHFDLVKSEDRAYMAEQFKTQIDAHLSHMGRFANETNMSSMLNKVTAKFYKGVMLESFDKGNKLGTITMMARQLGRESKNSWDTMNKKTKSFMQRFISEPEWDALRTKNTKNLFSTSNVDALSKEEVSALYEKSDKSVPFESYQSDLYRRVYSTFLEGIKKTVLAPGDFERAFLLQGTDPSSATGVLLRTLTQFKQFTFTYIDRIMIDGLREADGATQKLMWAISLMVSSMPLAYLSMTIENLAMGKSNPDPSKMNVPQRIKFFGDLMAPSFYLFTQQLDVKDPTAMNLAWSLISTPSLQFMFNSLAVPVALANGNVKAAKKNAKKAASYMAPINSTPILTPMLQHYMGDKAYLEPGQKKYF